MNSRNTGFKSALSRLMTPEGMANVVMPVAGIIESIATKGQSPGLGAQAMRTNVLADITRQQEQEQAEWEREQKAQIYKDQTEANRLAREKSQMDIETAKQEQLREAGLSKVLGLIDVYGRNPMATPEEKESYREKMLSKAFTQAYPQAAAEAAFKQKATMGTYEIDPDKIEGNTEAEKLAYVNRLRAANPDMKIIVKKPFTMTPTNQLAAQKTQLEIDLLKQKEQEAALAATQKAQKPIDTATDILAKVERLKTHPGLKGAVGIKGASGAFGLLPDPIPGTPEADFVAEFEGLSSLLTLGNIEKMRGMGQMSDKEGAMLKAAATSLRTSMSEKSFLSELSRIESGANRAIQYGGAPTTKKTPPSAQVTPKAAQSWPGAPAIGTVKNGYRYKGGNPNDKASWEAVK